MQPVLQLSTEVNYVKGIGPSIAESLAEKNIRTVEDLLYHLPFRYEDRLHPRPLSELNAGETASTVAEVRGVVLLRTRKMPSWRSPSARDWARSSACGSTGPT